MKKKKKKKKTPAKPRDWNTVSAIARTSAGPMKDKKKYIRKKKYPNKIDETNL